MKFLKSLFQPQTGKPLRDQDPQESPLKRAFREAREARNIDLVLPVFRKATLFVVAGSDGGAGDLNDLFLTPSPGGSGPMCVTVSERQEWLASIAWPKRQTTGEDLLRRLPPLMQIVVVYGDGGDFISSAHREWYVQLLQGSASSG